MEGDGGDKEESATGTNFNPLPPHGGRRIRANIEYQHQHVFQSTPSAWRETRKRPSLQRTPSYFNPLPPHGGRPREAAGLPALPHFNPLPPHGGRLFPAQGVCHDRLFQSTPSAWRETLLLDPAYRIIVISIHSLRMEGDPWNIFFSMHRHFISIHSLRMEGDIRGLF